MSTKKIGSFTPDGPGWHRIVTTKAEGVGASIEMFINGIPQVEWEHRPYERTDTPEARERYRELERYAVKAERLEPIDEPGPDRPCAICRRPALFSESNYGVCSVSCLRAEG